MPLAEVLSDRLGQIVDGERVSHEKGAVVELSDDDFRRHLEHDAVRSAKKSSRSRAAEADADGDPTGE